MRQDYEDDLEQILYGYPDEHPYYDDGILEEDPSSPPPNVLDVDVRSKEPPPTSTKLPPPTSAPNPDPRTGGAPDLGPLLRPYGGSFQRPQFGVAAKQLMDLIGPAPEFQAPALPTIAPLDEPDPFTFEDYTPTTAKDVLGDPSFGFRKNIGEQALMNSRAAQGLARTGGTLKDLLDYNQNFATQDFGNVDARRTKDYGLRRGNALENYQTNFGNKKSVYDTNTATTLGLYDRGFEGKRAEFEPKLYGWSKKGDLATRAEERARDNAFQEFQTDFDMWRSGQNDIFDRLKWASEFGRDTAAK